MGISQRKRKRGGKDQWCSLPSDLIRLIFTEVEELRDTIKFRSVCKSWRWATTPRQGGGGEKAILLPRLMLPYDPHSNVRSFFSLATKQPPIHLDLPEFHSKLIRGSSHGWLVLLDPDTTTISLLNPVTGSQIHLPPATDFPRDLGFHIVRQSNQWIVVHQAATNRTFDQVYLTTASLSSNIPNSHSDDDDCVLIATFLIGPKFAFCRLTLSSSDRAWIVVDTALPYAIASVAYHKRKFYAIDTEGHIAICTASPPFDATLIPSVGFMHDVSHFTKSSQGELLLVLNYLTTNGFWKGFFDVFKLEDESNVQPKWSKITSFRENAILVSGINQCVCIPSRGWIRPGCIYFAVPRTDPDLSIAFPEIYTKHNTDHDIFRYEIRCEKLQKQPKTEMKVNFKKLAWHVQKNYPQGLRRAFWITPSFQ